MSYLKKIKNPILSGAILLTLAGTLSRVMGFFYRIFLSRTIGATALGIYQLSFPLFAFCLCFSAAGIQTTISKFVADATARGDEPSVKSYATIGTICSCTLSIIFSLLIYHNASFLAEKLLKEPLCAPLLQACSYALFPACFHACINGLCYGRKKTLLPSITQLIEQLARIMGVYLMYRIVTSKGEQLMALHAMWGIVIGEILSFLVTISVTGHKVFSLRIKKQFSPFLRMAIPLSVSHIIMNACSMYENLLIPQRLQLYGYRSNEALAIYGTLTGIALSVILFPSVITGSLSVLLLPAISEAKAKKRADLISSAIQKVLIYGFLFGFLFTALFFLSGNFIGSCIYKNELAGNFIRRLCWICPLMYVSHLLGSILQGLGYAKTTLTINLSSCMVRIIMIFWGIPKFGIYAYLWGILLSWLLSTVLAISFLVHHLSFSVFTECTSSKT